MNGKKHKASYVLATAAGLCFVSGVLLLPK